MSFRSMNNELVRFDFIEMCETLTENIKRAQGLVEQLTFGIYLNFMLTY